ncbi:phospho-sugar mutase [Paenibacillus sp. TRM 82003]|nr:phospho-sugar mutase [Paenibacillus sp. TRM 82003]
MGRGQEPYDNYLRWVQSNMPEWMRRELDEMNEAQLKECFGKHLEFGTGGLRAEIGVGTNRMNLFTVRRITQGLADYLNSLGAEYAVRGVAIAYDSRKFSQAFADEAGLVLARNGIRAYVFEELRPTPILSFAVRQLKAAAGIVITASHNPAEYNGYKVYGEDGGQIPPHVADAITEAIDAVESELTVETMNRQEALIRGLYVKIGRKVDIGYYLNVQSQILQSAPIRAQREQMKIVYTPLHGAGNRPVRDLLRMAGFQEVFTVEAQEHPDENFSTVASPNPEEQEALRMAIDLAERLDADLVMGTDPDADRVGIAVRNQEGQFVCLTGNQTGALMLEYVLSQLHKQERLPANGVMIKTIVTSELGRVIASEYGVETLDTLTGFKYIGEKIGEFERTGEKQFLFGYEESYGYLVGSFVRDKDAVQSCLLIAEMAAYYRSIGMSVYEALMRIYEKYGYYEEGLHSITLKGLEGVVRINKITEYLREHMVTKLGERWKVRWIQDYQRQEAFHLTSNRMQRIELPRSNVLKYTLDDDCWFAVRPSGTEPKLKIYFGAVGGSASETEVKLESLKGQVLHLIDNIQSYLGLEVSAR